MVRFGGNHGRIALFPGRGHGARIRSGIERVADRLHGTRLDSPDVRPALSHRAFVRTAHCRLRIRLHRNGDRRVRRTFRAAPHAARRSADRRRRITLDALFARHKTTERPVLPLHITRKIFFYGLATILPRFLIAPFDIAPAVLLRPAVWGNLPFLGLVASMGCYLRWNAAIHRLGAVRTTDYIYLNPLATIVTAAISSVNASPLRRPSGPHWYSKACEGRSRKAGSEKREAKVLFRISSIV